MCLETVTSAKRTQYGSNIVVAKYMSLVKELTGDNR
jgi:hypothetical protein